MDENRNDEIRAVVTKKFPKEQRTPPTELQIIAPPGLEQVYRKAFLDIESPVPIILDLTASQGDEAGYDAKADCIYYSVEEKTLTKVIKGALSSNPNLLKGTIESYLESFDKETKNGIEKRQAILNGTEQSQNGITITQQDVLAYQQKREKNRSTLLQLSEGHDIHSENAVPIVNTLTEYYFRHLIKYSHSMRYHEPIPPRTDLLLRTLAPHLADSIKDLSDLRTPKALKTLRHEVWHSRFTNELHRKFLGNQQLADLEDEISGIGVYLVDNEFSNKFPQADQMSQTAETNDYKFFTTNNQRVLEIGYEMMPNHLKEAYLYRAYMIGIEEVLIPLIEIAQYGTEIEIDRLRRVPQMYWKQPGIRLPPQELLTQAKKAAESGQGLTEIITQLSNMMDIDKFQKYIKTRT